MAEGTSKRGLLTPNQDFLGTDTESSIKRVVLCNHPPSILIFFRHREQIFVGSFLRGAGVALAFVMQDDQRRSIFPFHQVPRDQWMLRLGIADELRALLAIVLLLLPLR